MTLAQTGLRLGLTREEALRGIRAQSHGADVTRAAFVRAWATARRLERAFPPLQVSRP